jgi:hypothetical protein
MGDIVKHLSGNRIIGDLISREKYSFVDGKLIASIVDDVMAIVKEAAVNSDYAKCEHECVSMVTENGQHMKAYSKEFCEVQEGFERTVKSGNINCIYRLERSPKTEKHSFYQNGETDKAFQMFMQGYEYGIKRRIVAER